MRSLAFFLLLLQAPSSEPPWSELSLSIEKDPGYSSDQVVVCRVRVVNHGARTWPGRSLHFEARALDGGARNARDPDRLLRAVRALRGRPRRLLARLRRKPQEERRQEG
jgi:hypothetical protein